MEFFHHGVLLKTNIMEANQILQSDILDIIFEGKNKSYGAYDLRKTYNSRVSLALLLMFSLIGLFIAGLALNKDNTDKVFIRMVSDDTELTPAPDNPLPIPPPPPPEKLILVEKISTVHLATLRISPDEEVLVPPPSKDEIETSRIGLETIIGSVDLGIIQPPDGVPGSKVFSAPVDKKDGADEVLIIVEKEASFPGGIQKWSQYIQRAILNELDSQFSPCFRHIR